jgi:hypothetical protein
MASPAELMALGMAHPGLPAGLHCATRRHRGGQRDNRRNGLTGSFIEVGTAGASTGVKLPGPSFYVVYNGGANAVKVYPPTGSYMNGTQNAAFSVTNAKNRHSQRLIPKQSEIGTQYSRPAFSSAGDPTKRPVKPVGDDERRRWPQEYEAFRNKMEAPLVGTPLSAWASA